MKFAILCLLGASARHHRPHHRQNVQFVDGDFDNTNAFLDDPQQYLYQAPRMPVAKDIGVRFVQSDPIHGSLGVLNKKKDLTMEESLEAHLRSFKPLELKDDQEQVVDTAHSLDIAEKMHGSKLEWTDMSKVTDPKINPPAVAYKLADSDDEEDDTYETRKSITTAEKSVGQKFFVSKRNKNKFEAAQEKEKAEAKADADQAEKVAKAAEKTEEPAGEKKEEAAAPAEKAEEFTPPELGEGFGA